jgi:hypothetical protein
MVIDQIDFILIVYTIVKLDESFAQGMKKGFPSTAHLIQLIIETHKGIEI